MKERFVNETKLPTESLSKSMGTSEKMSGIENLNSELLISSAQCGGAKTDVDFETKSKYKDSVELEKLRIQAISDIGKAYAANRPINIMFLGHSGALVTQ